MAKKNQNTPKPKKNFSLDKQIRGLKQGSIEGELKLYKMDVMSRDKSARIFIESTIPQTGPKDIYPGQLIMFNYLNPQNKEELEYYDAKPCTIFFGEHDTKEGRRVIGFNIHYFPTKIRHIVMDKLFDIYKSSYLKSWDDPLDSDMPQFNYRILINKLQENGLEFGVRMYIPNLMGAIRAIPPKWWAKAIFTEGRFKKQTMSNIMNYWKKKLAEGLKKKNKKKTK